MRHPASDCVFSIWSKKCRSVQRFCIVMASVCLRNSSAERRAFPFWNRSVRDETMFERRANSGRKSRRAKPRSIFDRSVCVETRRRGCWRRPTSSSVGSHGNCRSRFCRVLAPRGAFGVSLWRRWRRSLSEGMFFFRKLEHELLLEPRHFGPNLYSIIQCDASTRARRAPRAHLVHRNPQATMHRRAGRHMPWQNRLHHLHHRREK